MFFSKEENMDDVVFGIPSTREPTRSTISDYRYNKELMRTYAFNTTNTTVYGIVDGVPLIIPHDNGFSKLRKVMGDIDIYEPGVFIIKTYTYRHIEDISSMVEYWHGSDMNMPEETIEQIKEFIINFTSKSYRDDKVKFRLIEFISYADLLAYDRFSKIFGGTISISIKNRYTYTYNDNKITISLKGDGETKWLTLGDKILPLQTSKRVSKNELLLQHSASKVENYAINKLSDINIFDTQEEASSNTNTNNIKRDKHLLEVDKLKYDEKKLIAEVIQTEEKNELVKFTNEISYKTEIIKLILSENSLTIKEMENNRVMLESGLKVFSAVENILKQFKGKK